MLFSELSQYFQKIEDTQSRNKMTEILAQLFRASSKKEIAKICYLLQGRVAPLYEAVEFGVADKFMIRAIASSYEKEVGVVVKEFKKLGDLGKTAEHLHTGTSRDMDVEKVYERLRAVALCGGKGSQEQKITLLSQLIAHLSALSARYVVRIPLGKLRLGFSELTILDALSWMLKGDKSLRKQLESAYNVRPDIGFIARTVKKSGIKGLAHVQARVGTPVFAELCQRLPNATEMIKKMGEVAVEPKYDGVRTQIHFRRSRSRREGDFVQTYSRNLEHTTEMFPELLDMGKQVKADEVILDCEAIGINPKTGKIISFQETTTRKRKHDIELARKSVPLLFFVFDILYKDGRGLLEVPLVKRRKILEKTVKSKGDIFAVSPQIITTDPEAIRIYHDTQLHEGLEGVVVKKRNSPYEPGRRGYGWVKFKEEEGKTGKLTDTIDAVVMGYYFGEGKRAGFGIGALLVGVRNKEAYVTVTKIGTGVSDELWKKLKKKLSAIHARKQPKEYHVVTKNLVPDVWVVPKGVLERAGDDLTKSPRHGAGFAVRFPRLVRIRGDKSPQQVTTTKELDQMFKSQMHHTKK